MRYWCVSYHEFSSFIFEFCNLLPTLNPRTKTYRALLSYSCTPLSRAVSSWPRFTLPTYRCRLANRGKGRSPTGTLITYGECAANLTDVEIFVGGKLSAECPQPVYIRSSLTDWRPSELTAAYRHRVYWHRWRSKGGVGPWRGRAGVRLAKLVPDHRRSFLFSSSRLALRDMNFSNARYFSSCSLWSSSKTPCRTQHTGVLRSGGGLRM